MQCLASRSVAGRSARVQTVRKGLNARKFMICRAENETIDVSVNSVPPSASSAPVPEWVPAQAVPVLEFFNKEDFKLQDSSFYRSYIEPYLQNETVSKSIGWKRLPETINGRLAMLGFVGGVSAEIFRTGSLLQQLGKAPQPVLLIVALITAASIIPVVKGTNGEYLGSLKDTMTLPEGVFTEPMERIHGRIAMVGVVGLLLVEMLKGSALF